MDRLLSMNCFARTVETGSFSSAARDLGLGQPTLSRSVAALEDYLQTRLLQRTTRQLNLTPEGERYYAQVRRILDAVAEAESSLRDETEPSGLLRVACPTALAHAFVIPYLASFMAKYHELNLDLQISDRYVSLVDEGAELAIRIGHLDDSALRARRIGMFERVCVASPAYLATHRAPLQPSDLLQHQCIVYTLLSPGNTWRFRSGEVAVTGRLRVNSPQAVQEAARSGIGIAHGPRWLFEDELQSGQLQLLLANEQAAPVPVQILYVANRLLPKRAIVFMDYMSQVFASIPALNAGPEPAALA